MIPVVLMTGLFLRIFVFTPIALAPTALAPTGLTLGQASQRVYRPEHWCFVGENTLGRHCVKSDVCAPIDRYASREMCEYSEGSALPLGITGGGGLYYNAFMQPDKRRYHTF